MESRAPVVGVLLAAGSGSRFGGDKLLAALEDGTAMGERALANLTAAVDSVVAVVRPGDDVLAQALAQGGARVTVCPNAAEGMGESLAWGVRGAPVAAGWIVALADMPWTASGTIVRIADALRGSARLVAPSHRGMRGHPVGISARYFGELCALSGDEGARRILGANADSLTLIETDDAGVVRDVDIRADLGRDR
jgi:molybdenum cofactor cytidylyltransferase